MAAIIAQMTRANRERKRKRRYEISKCMYELPPYAPRFEPKLHNKYLRACSDTREKINAENFQTFVIQRLETILKEEEDNRAFSWRTFLCEATLISLSVLFVPALMILVQIYWPDESSSRVSEDDEIADESTDNPYGTNTTGYFVFRKDYP